MDIPSLTAAHPTGAQKNRFDPKAEERYYRSATWTPWPVRAAAALVRAARPLLHLQVPRPTRPQPGSAAK